MLLKFALRASPILTDIIVNDLKPEGGESGYRRHHMQNLELLATMLFGIFLFWRSARWFGAWRRGDANPRGLIFVGMGWILLISYGNQHFS